MTTETTQDAAQGNEAIMRRINSLLELARHAETPTHERERAQDKADALMAKYRIDRAMLNFQHKDEAREVMNKTVEMMTGDYYYEMNNMMTAVFKHAGCQVNRTWSKITAVGYEEDLFYADILWITVQQDFITQMFPKWETNRGFDANVFIIKCAGYSWSEVREMGLEKQAFDITGMLTAENAGSKLRTAYKREAKRRGIIVQPGKQQPMNPKLFRDSFAAGYEATLANRLRVMAAANEAPGEYALALQTDADRVLAEFYRLFPHLHPDYIAEQNRKYDEEERARWNALSDAEKERERRENARWARRKGPKVREADMRGWSAGASAAKNVALGRNNVDANNQGALQ